MILPLKKCQRGGGFPTQTVTELARLVRKTVFGTKFTASLKPVKFWVPAMASEYTHPHKHM